MPQLTWGNIGDRIYESGVDRGVLYVGNQPGVVWNGLTSISEDSSGGEATPYYIDGEKYLNSPSAEEFEATIEAFSYPTEFEQCDGTAAFFGGLLITRQPRKPFGLSYRTKVGNDVDGINYGYKIHLIYNALATPSQRPNKTLNDSSDLTSLSWKITTRPPSLTGYKRTAHFIIDSRRTDPSALMVIEQTLYGTDSSTARLPMPAEIFTIFETNSSFVVVDNGDGTWTATGNDFEVHMLDDTTFQIDTPGVAIVDADNYTLTSP